jgi:energy-coupling factor transporter ATP-binding protein EcfA2
MTRCSEAALEAALRERSEHAASSRARSNWISTFLVAKRMEAAGYQMTIAGANLAVSDLFVLLPEHGRGRINPFVDLKSDYRWTQVENSGRKTVWNTGTRTGAQTVLFNEGHFSNGLRADAVDILLAHLGTDEPLPARDALSVLITRTRDWPSTPTRADLHAVAREYVGLSAIDFDRITADTTLDVSLLDGPTWSPEALESSTLGPPGQAAAQAGAGAAADHIPMESVEQLPEQFKKFLVQFGIGTSGTDEILDMLAAVLSSQFVMLAGPSGSGKSTLGAALAGFFATAGRRGRLESARLLARPEEFLGYYSELAGAKFIAYDPVLTLLEISAGDASRTPVITVEEANLSPIEGYMPPLLHGLGGIEAENVAFVLHYQPGPVETQIPGRTVPPALVLRPYPRFIATLNVDPESPAPVRKMVSRACVVLLETPTWEKALEAADTLVHPSIEEATGPASAFIGRPTIAFDRYTATGSELYEQALAERAAILRGRLGVDVIGHRQLQRSLMYMSWFVELAGQRDPDQGNPAVDAAADNAFLHFVLPSLPAAQFEPALEALDDGSRKGVLASRLTRLRSILKDHQFGPPPDFWGALS